MSSTNVRVDTHFRKLLDTPGRAFLHMYYSSKIYMTTTHVARVDITEFTNVYFDL